MKESSPLLGNGVFADQFICTGTLIWKYKRGENVDAYKGERQVRKFLATLSSDAERTEWLDWSYCKGGYLNGITDNGKLVNHSEEPNT